MLKPFLKIGNRTMVVVLEIAAVLLLVIAIAVSVLVWRVSQGPVSLSFAKDYVGQALNGLDENIAVSFDDIVLSWPELQGPLRMDLSGLRVRQGAGEANTLTIDEASIGLSRRALLFGAIRPVSVIIRGPALELVRTHDGRLSLFIRDNAGTKEEAPVTEGPKAAPGEDVAQMFRDMAHNRRGSPIARLREFRIEDASVAVRDHEFGLSWYLTDFDFTIGRQVRGIAASLVVALPGGREESSTIALDMVYRKETDDFRGAGHVQDLNPYFVSQFLPVPEELGGQDLYFTGDMELALDSKLRPTYVKFDGEVPDGQIVLPKEYDTPIAINNIKVESEYSLSERLLKVPVLSGEIGGITFTGSAEANFADDKVEMPVRLTVKQTSREKIAALFPKSEQDGDAYAWVGRRIEGGSFSDVNAEIILTAEKIVNPDANINEWDFDVPELKLGFDFEGAKVTYSDKLMPATDARGKGNLDIAKEILAIEDASAKIGDIDGSDVSVFLTDFMRSGSGYVTVEANLNGPVATALEYIASEPIGMGANEIGIDAKTVTGNIEAKLTVALPTTKNVLAEEVEVGIEGTLTDMNVPGIVEGLPLSGGPLALKTEPGGFTIKGDAQLAGRATTLDWHQYFNSKDKPYSMKVSAKLGADHELRSHFGVNLDDYISGTMPVDVVYTQKRGGAAQVDVKGDLAPVRVHITPFKYEKPMGAPGTVTATAHLQNDALKELTNVILQSETLSVSNATIGFAPINGKKADIASGTLPDAVIGKTKAAVDFKVDANNVMNITAKASTFDFAPFLPAGKEVGANGETAVLLKEKKQQQAMRISLTADKMLLKNEQSADAAKAYIIMDESADPTHIEFDGTVGKSALNVRFVPDAKGVRTFRLRTDDGGAALYAFGLYDNIHGGRLRIYGRPDENDPRGNLQGGMRMENFRVVKAPALASLLSLMSLTGINQLLTNEGLVFSKLESGFEWRFREAGNVLLIKDGTTSGSSIGLTFAGTVDFARGTTDVAGTIIPMTEVNSLISKIPLIGDILGGPTGLIAATYTMKGPSNSPQIAVNPLSVLAPGILRRLLFEGGFSQSIPGEDEAMSEDVSAPAAAAPAEDRRAPRTAGTGLN